MSKFTHTQKSGGGDKNSTTRTSTNTKSSIQHSNNKPHQIPYSNRREYIMYLQRTIGNQAVGKLFRSGYLQKKLNIGPANDKYEQEADHIADQVVSRDEPISDSQQTGAISNTLSRKPLVNKITPIQKKPITSENSGKPLTPNQRSFFEPRFGTNFANVRLHTDTNAAHLARLVSARAFTTGGNIYFGRGEYSPNTMQGKRLMAHELTHTVQQTGKSGVKQNVPTIQRKSRDTSRELTRDTGVTIPAGTLVNYRLNQFGQELWSQSSSHTYQWTVYDSSGNVFYSQATTQPKIKLQAVMPGSFKVEVQVINNGVPVDSMKYSLTQNIQCAAGEWLVNMQSKQKILRYLRDGCDLSDTVRQLHSLGFMDELFDRFEAPADRRVLIQLLGKRLNPATEKLIKPMIANMGSEWELQYNLGRMGVTSQAPAFNTSAYSHLISSSDQDPFTGSGATGVNPTTLGISLADQALLAGGHAPTVAEYSNPLGGLPAYLATLTPQQRKEQAQLLLQQPISSVMPESYGGKLPSRAQIIIAAANTHNLHPELVGGFLLAEQRDQSKNEDAKDYIGATSIMSGNTSIGLGQVVVSTATRNDLFSDLLSSGTRSGLGHDDTAKLLASDEFNIFAVAKYMRQVADDGATRNISTLPSTQSTYPGINMAAYANNSASWPDDNIKALASEYTSRAWDDNIYSYWANFVFEAYKDVQAASVFP